MKFSIITDVIKLLILYSIGDIHDRASLINMVRDMLKYLNRIAKSAVKDPISICENYVARVSFDNSHDTRIISSGACRALNGSPALKRIVKVLVLRVLLRRSIFWYAWTWTATNANDRKMRFSQQEDSHSVFVRNYRDLVAVVTSGKWLRVTRDMINFIS